MTVFNHVGQCTPDLARARRFYVELLGFEVDRELVVPDAGSGPLLGIDPPVNLTALYLSREEFVLELMAFDRAGNPPRAARVMNEPGLTHISLSVDDLAGTADRVVEYGGEVVFRSPRVVMIRDPDGQLLELLPMSYRDSITKAADPR